MTEIRARITPYQKTAAELADDNDIPLQGERVRATDTGRWKTGDGTTHYNDLRYDDAPAILALAATPEVLVTGSIAYSSTGAATSFALSWPDGATGTFTGTESAAFPGAIDSYSVTHVLAGVTTTYTQAALTRDSTSGAVTNRPAITWS